MTEPNTPYSFEIAREFITRLAAGETELAICADDHMPSRWTVYRWRNQHADFDRAYDRACVLQADALAADTVYIADTDRDPQRARNRATYRQWLAGKRNRQKYGDKIDITVTEKPSLRAAIEHAAGNISGPMRDQLLTVEEQVIDCIDQFFGDPDDYESHALTIPVIDPDAEEFQ